MKRNVWLDGMFGVVVGDALGCLAIMESFAAKEASPPSGLERSREGSGSWRCVKQQKTTWGAEHARQVVISGVSRDKRLPGS